MNLKSWVFKFYILPIIYNSQITTNLITTKIMPIMKEFYVTFFGDVCGVKDADVKMYGKSLKSIKPKIRDHAHKLGNDIDLIQVYNCTNDKLHEAHLKTLNFRPI